MTGDADGREPMPGMTEEDHKRIYYSVVWPNMLYSLHPDYLMLHFITPLEPGRTHVRCEWYFEPREMAKPDFNPDEAIEFWDLTNRQDWYVCELQQQGTKSRAFTQGRYSAMESSVHGFRPDGGGPLRGGRCRHFAGSGQQAGQRARCDRARAARRTGTRCRTSSAGLRDGRRLSNPRRSRRKGRCRRRGVRAGRLASGGKHA